MFIAELLLDLLWYSFRAGDTVLTPNKFFVKQQLKCCVGSCVEANELVG